MSLFVGHFPEYAVMPGVLIVEALAQVGAVAILNVESNRGKLGFWRALTVSVSVGKWYRVIRAAGSRDHSFEGHDR